MPETKISDQPKPISLAAMIQLNDAAQIESALNELSPVETARLIADLDKADHIQLLEILGPEEFANIISKISGLGAVNMVAHLTSEQAAPIVNELPHQMQVSFLRRMTKNRASEILHDIGPHQAKKLEGLMRYPENTAGGLMITEYLSYPENMLVKEVLDDLRERGEIYSDFDIQYA